MSGGALERKLELSVIVPVYNEQDSLRELHRWLTRVLEARGYDYEILFIDDGSTDLTPEVLRRLSIEDACVKMLRFRRNYGKSAALYTGFQLVSGDMVVTLDADMQDSPDEIPALCDCLRQGFDLVSGWKKNRQDPLGKRWLSKLFNWVTARVSGIPIHDFNSGLKAYRREVAQSMSLYGEMHRYIPLIVRQNGFSRITEKPVAHYPRKYGKSKYKSDRLIKGFLDLLSVSFVSRFRRKPMHFFGTLGMLFFVIGSCLTLYLVIEKQYRLRHHLPVREVVDQPLFYLSLVAAVVGCQLFLTGFVSEIISVYFSRGDDYLIETKRGFSQKDVGKD